MRKQGAYIVTFGDWSKSILRWDGNGWESFGCTFYESTVELGYVRAIKWIEGQ